MGDCCDAVRDACVGQSSCANRVGLKVLALGDAMFDGLLVPTFDLEMMQNTCKLVNECTWGDGSSMFKELNDGELAPFTVVKREVEGEGGISPRDVDMASYPLTLLSAAPRVVPWEAAEAEGVEDLSHGKSP